MKGLLVPATIGVATIVGCFPLQAASPEVIELDYGPGTGLIFSAGYLNNQWEQQSLADSVRFPVDMPIIGYNLFTSPKPVATAGTAYRVSFWTDAGGRPGSLLAQQDVTPESIQYVGKWPTTSDSISFDVDRVSFRFDPVVLSANTTYWVRATSVGFQIGQYASYSPGDGQFMVFPGPSMSPYGAGFGDLMFQLVSVPEPSVFGIAAAGVLTGCFLSTRRCARHSPTHR
jgi:hypothetical protein